MDLFSDFKHSHNLEHNAAVKAMRTLALDVRLDPSVRRVDRACRRIPEIVGLTFVERLEDLELDLCYGEVSPRHF